MTLRGTTHAQRKKKSWRKNFLALRNDGLELLFNLCKSDGHTGEISWLRTQRLMWTLMFSYFKNRLVLVYTTEQPAQTGKSCSERWQCWSVCKLWPLQNPQKFWQQPNIQFWESEICSVTKREAKFRWNKKSNLFCHLMRGLSMSCTFVTHKTNYAWTWKLLQSCYSSVWAHKTSVGNSADTLWVCDWDPRASPNIYVKRKETIKNKSK